MHSYGASSWWNEEGMYFTKMLKEIARLVQFARAGWSLGRRPWIGMAAGAIAVVTYVLLTHTATRHALWSSGEVRASLPIFVELARLPMSVFLPTPYLPEWGAVLQLLVVLGLGEILVGKWAVLSSAALGQIASTFAARFLVNSSYGHLVGLPHQLAHSLDTGPSAVTVAVGACLFVAIRSYRLTAVFGAALLISSIAIPGLDGPEHLVAFACGLVVGVASHRWGSEDPMSEAMPGGSRQIAMEKSTSA